MKNKYAIIQTIFLTVVLFGFISGSGQSDKIMNTSGEVTFSIKTLTDNGNFAPKHVLAIWVEDDMGFVKTRKLRANQRKQYLYTWRSASNDNVVDAVTGATLSSHQTHTVIWDCTDVDGNVLPDGDYTIYVEFTEKHAQGPITSVTFSKGTDEQHLTPPDEDNFVNISLDYIPETTNLDEISENNITVYPNPGNGLFTIELPGISENDISVYNSSGQKVIEDIKKAESNRHVIDLTRFNSGIYFIEIRNQANQQLVKIIKQ